MRKLDFRNTVAVVAMGLVLLSPGAAVAATATATTPPEPSAVPTNPLPDVMPYGPGGMMGPGGQGSGPGMMGRGGEGGTYAMPMMRGQNVGFDDRGHRRGWLCAVMIAIVLLLAAIAVMLAMLVRGPRQRGSALHVLEQRFAAGEIDEQDFQARRAALGSK